MEVVDLLSDAEELAEHSSDERRAVITITDTEDEAPCVAVETEQERSCLNAAVRRLESLMSSRLNRKKLFGARSVGSVTNSQNSSETLQLLNKAHREIRTLQGDTQRLKSVKSCLFQQRNTYIRELSLRSGKSEHRILRELQQLSSKQRRMKKRHETANQPSVGGGASSPSAVDTSDEETEMTSFTLQQQTPQAPPTPVAAPPTTTPVQTPVHLPQANSQTILQVSTPTLAPLRVSHNTSVLRDRPKTVPNILSRRRYAAPSSPSHTQNVEGKLKESQSFQALVPAEVLSVVGAAASLGQKVLTLSPIAARQTVLQTSTPGVTSVTLSISSLTNEQIHLASLPRPPVGKISSSTHITITNLTATNFNNLLQLVQPSTIPPPQQTQQQQTPQQTQLHQQTQNLQQTQQHQQSHKQTHQQTQQQQTQQTQHMQQTQKQLTQLQQKQQTQHQQTLKQQTQHQHPHQQVPSGLPHPLPLPVVSAGSDLSSDLTRDLDQHPSRTDSPPESPPSTRGISSCPGGSTGCQAGAGEAREDPDESLTSLLNEIVFLNQQAVTTVTTAERQSSEVGQQEEGHAHSPWLLQLDSDSNDTEEEEAGLNDHTETTQSRPLPGPANGNTTGSTLAPPPLLHMKVGGVTVVDPPTSSNGAEGGEGEIGGRREGREGSLAWRPMPRLVPLGLRGNPPS